MGCGDCGQQIVHGAVGLAKAGLQALGVPVDRAPADEVLRRRDLCRECPEATRNAARLDRTTKGLTTLSRCRRCDCLIGAKTMLASERCPAGKW